MAEPTTLVALRRIRALATQSTRAIQSGGARNGISALAKIAQEADDGIRYATDPEYVEHVEGDLAELRAAFVEACELADGEAVDACGLLLDSLSRYLGLVRA